MRNRLWSWDKVSVTCLLMIVLSTSFAVEVPIEDFSIKAYPQNINEYLPPDSADYNQALLSSEYQQTQVQQFFNHYYASDNKGLSPWSESMIRAVLPSVKKIELALLDEFDNQQQGPAQQHYGEHFKEHDEIWLNKMRTTMALEGLESQTFNPQNNAIVVTNTAARALPDTAPDFYHFSLAGQGFPFDNLQESALWVGTPLHVLHVSRDKAWSLVLSPDGYFGWVKSNDIAYASAAFIQQWQNKARQGLMAITQTESSVLDKGQHFLFSAYIGAVFPLAQQSEHQTTIFIPIKNSAQQALMSTATIAKNAAHLMPMPASKKTIAALIKQLQNRPYGWGGAYFFNDCSQELKSLFTPLGIWLPRNSAQQGKSSSLDLSSKTLDERLNLLQSKGHPLMTLIYIGGHVMLYLGNKPNKKEEQEAITYQNVWGLSPASKDKRFVIGQSLLIPLLKSYAEHPEASSLADKAYFKLVFLDELSSSLPSPQAFANQLMGTLNTMEESNEPL